MNELEQLQDGITKNKKAIFSALSALNVGEVSASYSGSGDSGSINDITFWIKNKKTKKFEQVFDWKKICGKTPKITITEINHSWGSTQFQLESKEKELDIYEAVETYLYQVLESRHPGWEINAGSNGDFQFFVEDNKIDWSHCTMIEDYETSTL